MQWVLYFYTHTERQTMNNTTNTTPVADILHYSNILTQYITVPPDIFTTDDTGQAISELLWVIERDSDGDESLSVTLDCINKEIRLLERNDESFSQTALFWLIGFSHQHDIKVTRMNASFKDEEPIESSVIAPHLH